MTINQFIKKYLSSTLTLIIFSSALSCDTESSNNAELIDSYKGKWVRGEQGGCVESSSSETSSKTYLTFKDDFNYTKTIEVHDGKECNSLVLSVDQHGSISITGDVSTILGAFTITKSISKQEYTPHTEKSVIKANSDKGYCEITDWKITVARDVTNKTCLNSSDEDISSLYVSRELGKLNKDRDIMLLSEDGKTIYFGKSESKINTEDSEDKCKDNDSSDNLEECFPTEIDESAVTAFTKVEETKEESTEE